MTRQKKCPAANQAEETNKNNGRVINSLRSKNTTLFGFHAIPPKKIPNNDKNT